MFSFKKYLLLGALLSIFESSQAFSATKTISISDYKNLPIEFTQEDLSSWSDLPPGTYQVPNSQVIISGFKKSGAPGLLFGGVGVLVQGAFNSKSAKKSLGGENPANLELSLVEEGQSIIDAKILSGKYGDSFSVKKEDSAPVLKVTSAIVITFSSDTDARPFIVFKANLMVPKEKKPIWSNRYIVSLGKTVPFDGDSSLMSSGGAELKRLVALDLDRAADLMLSDISSPISRSDENLISVEGKFIFLRQPLLVSAYKLTEDEETLTFLPNTPIGASTIVGVSLIDKNEITQTPLKKGEQFIKEARVKRKK